MMYSPEFEKFWAWFGCRPDMILCGDACHTIKDIIYTVWIEAQKAKPVQIRTEIVYRDKDEKWISTGDEC